MHIIKLLVRWIADYDRKDSIGSRLRTRRIGPLLSMIEETYRVRGRVGIIDVGGTKAYWNILPAALLRERNVHITIVNLPGTALPPNDTHFSFVEGDGCDLRTHRDRAFDIAHSNSVIEHVGDWDRMSCFSRELARVAVRYYVQTPNYWFPIEPHFMMPFFHWLPKPLRVWLLLTLRIGWRGAGETVDSAVRAIENARLLDKRMFGALFADARIETERVLLLPKSLIALRDSPRA